MASFRDTDGTEWKLVLTVGLAADVKRETGVNLAYLSKDARWVSTIFDTDGKLAEILWVMCEKQALERGVTPEQFPYLLDGRVLEEAGAGLAQSIADFFPNSRIAKALREGWAKTVTEMEDKVIAAIAATSTASPSPTSAPESSESIPAS